MPYDGDRGVRDGAEEAVIVGEDGSDDERAELGEVVHGVVGAPVAAESWKGIRKGAEGEKGLLTGVEEGEWVVVAGEKAPVLAVHLDGVALATQFRVMVDLWNRLLDYTPQGDGEPDGQL